MTTNTATEQTKAQKVTAAFQEAERLILPAKLANVPTNVFSVMAYVTGQALDPEKPESYVAAFKALYSSLDWVVKPAKLLSEEQNDKPRNQNDAAQDQSAFAAKAKAAQKTDADVAEKAELIKQCKSLISSYRPIRNNREDARERTDMQTKWTADLNEAAKRSVSAMRDFTKTLTAKIQKRYAEREKASERI